MEENWVFLSMWRTCTSPSKTRFMSADSKFKKSMKRHRLFRQNQMWIQELFWGWSIPTKFANLFFKESKLFIFYYNYLSLLTSLKEGPYCHRGVLFGHLLFVACIYTKWSFEQPHSLIIRSWRLNITYVFNPFYFFFRDNSILLSRRLMKK